MSQTTTLPTVCLRCGRASQAESALPGCPWCLEEDLCSADGLDLWECVPDEDGWDGFVVGEEIGAGGMGVVFRARQLTPSRDVALKMLSAGLVERDGARRRLLAEAEALAELDHPGILPLYASGEKDGCPWLAMKLAGGGSLAGQIPAWDGRWEEIATLAAGLADAVQHAHERGVIHRDLKPANILFDDAGRAFVADFGLAKWTQRDGGQTVSQAVLGTPAFMAPEVARGGAGAATTAADVYGLGSILYQLVSGRPPFAGPTPVETARQVVADVVKPPRVHRAGIPRDLEAVVLKALSSEPGRRYATAAALAEDLRAFAAGRPVVARQPGPAGRAWLWARRHPLPAALAAGIFGIIIVSGTVLWGALTRAKAARADAEDLVAFMVRDLPSKVSHAGQLGLLDSAFADVAAYYARQDTSDPVALARKADFEAQWVGVLKRQGRVEEARQHAGRAVNSAALAARARSAGAGAWEVLGAAHRRQAELEILDAAFDDAQAHLNAANEALEEGLARHPGDAALLMEKVEMLNEKAFWNLKQNDPVAAVKAYTEAGEVLARIPAPKSEAGADRLAQLRLAAGSMMGEALMAAKKYDEATACFADQLSRVEAACASAPGNIPLQASLKVSLNHLADCLSRQPNRPVERLVELWRREEEVAAGLVANDKTNLQWQAEWALAALALANGARLQGDAAASREWLEKTVERLAPVPVGAHNEVLTGRVNALVYLTKNLDTAGDWEAGRRRCLEGMQAAWQRLEHDGGRLEAHNLFQRDFQTLFTIWLKREPEEAPALAAKWVARAEEVKAEGTGKLRWLLTAASLHRRLADALAKQPDGSAQASEENLASLRIRTRVLGDASQAGDAALIAEAAEEAVSSAKYVRVGTPSPGRAEEAVRLLVSVAPHFVRAGGKQAGAAAQEAAGLLAMVSDAERRALAAAVLAGFYPDSSSSGGAVPETLTSMAR